MLGALFASEVLRLPPCSLCWYQRIFMVPLVLLLPLGMFPVDSRVVRYTLPLALVGGAVALYHVLLVAGVVPESAAPCAQGVPCKEQPLVLLGFISLPLLSLAAFSLITVSLVAAGRKVTS